MTGTFDDLRSPQIRFLEEAGKLGELHVLLSSGRTSGTLPGKAPRFPAGAPVPAPGHPLCQERQRKSSSLPFGPDTLPPIDGLRPDVWVVAKADDTPQKRAFCTTHGLAYHVMTTEELRGFPTPPAEVPSPSAISYPPSAISYQPSAIGYQPSAIGHQPSAIGYPPSAISHQPSARKKVIVTGCFDWLHSGHVRFFEEVSGLGDLYVIVGHDANVRLLKGEGHPLFPADQRRYVAGSIRYVKQALISTGHGWMDAEPEIERLKPDAYAVNEDGDKPEKRAFCAEHGLEYIVLKRTPKAGLPRRASTDLRGF